MDPQIKAFLTIDEFERYRCNPSAFEKLKSLAEYIPSTSDINIP
jgi:hypothetical protein